MKTIVFEYHRGWNDVVTERVEYEDDTLREEIDADFEEWIWNNFVGDHAHWYEKETE